MPTVGPLSVVHHILDAGGKGKAGPRSLSLPGGEGDDMYKTLEISLLSLLL